MESEEQLRKRIEELENGLAQAKWRADMDRQTAERKEYVRKERQKENSYAYWAIAIFIVLPFFYYLLK